jgi:hypothetical protein
MSLNPETRKDIYGNVIAVLPKTVDYTMHRPPPLSADSAIIVFSVPCASSRALRR